MASNYLYRVYCTTEQQYRTVISDTEPTVCPVDSEPIDTNLTTILESMFEEITSEGYVKIGSDLADQQAIQICNGDVNGGIDIDAGFGGISIDSTNAVSIDAAAESNFTTSNGNLILNSTTGLLNLDGGSGINLGNDANSTPINIGTSSNEETLSMGNSTGATQVNILSGTGGILADAQGAISLDANGASSNFTLNATGDAQDLNIALLGSHDSSIIMTSQGTGADAIKLESLGGIQLSSFSGSNGLVLSGTAFLGLNNWSGGSVYLGTDTGSARTIFVGNATNATVDIDSGAGGVAIDSAGTISIDANAASSNISLTTTGDAQDLTFSLLGANDSSLFIDSEGTGADALTLTSDGGLQISSSSATHPILINSTGSLGINNNGGGNVLIGTDTGTTRTISIGNSTNATVDIDSGVGGILMDSAGLVSIDATGASSNFTLNTTGNGQDLSIALLGFNDSSLLMTSQGIGADAIKLESSGGMQIQTWSGSHGLTMNSASYIGFNNWSGGDVYIGTDSSNSRTIYIGHSAGTTALNLNSGTGGIAIGNDENGGEVQIANSSTAKTITMGNSTGASRLFARYGTGGIIKHQTTPVTLSDVNATLTVTNLLTQVLTGTPTVDRILTLPTAADVVSAITNCEVGDSFDFSIINKSSAANEADFILAMGTGGTMDGNDITSSCKNNAGTYESSGTGIFRLRIDNITASSEAYTIYRIG